MTPCRPECPTCSSVADQRRQRAVRGCPVPTVADLEQRLHADRPALGGVGGRVLIGAAIVADVARCDAVAELEPVMLVLHRGGDLERVADRLDIVVDGCRVAHRQSRAIQHAAIEVMSS